MMMIWKMAMESTRQTTCTQTSPRQEGVRDRDGVQWMHGRMVVEMIPRGGRVNGTMMIVSEGNEKRSYM